MKLYVFRCHCCGKLSVFAKDAVGVPIVAQGPMHRSTSCAAYGQAPTEVAMVDLRSVDEMPRCDHVGHDLRHSTTPACIRCNAPRSACEPPR